MLYSYYCCLFKWILVDLNLEFITSYTVGFFSDFFIGKYNLTSFNGIFSLNYLSLQMLKAELPLRKP